MDLLVYFLIIITIIITVIITAIIIVIIIIVIIGYRYWELRSRIAQLIAALAV